MFSVLDSEKSSLQQVRACPASLYSRVQQLASCYIFLCVYCICSCQCMGQFIVIQRREVNHLKHLQKCVKFQVLFRHVLSGEITVDRLVRMTPEQLASPELATWREQETKHVSNNPLFSNKSQTTFVLKSTKLLMSSLLEVVPLWKVFPSANVEV